MSRIRERRQVPGRLLWRAPDTGPRTLPVASEERLPEGKESDALASEAVHCNRCGGEIQKRSIRAGSVVCPKCRAAAGMKFWVNRGAHVAAPPAPELDPPKSGPVWTLTEKQEARARRRREACERLTARVLKSGRPGETSIRRRQKGNRRRPGGGAPRDGRIARDLEGKRPARLTRAQRADAREIARRLTARTAWRKIPQPSDVTPYQWEALRLVRAEGLSLAEAGQRMKPPISKQAISKLIRKATRGLTKRSLPHP